MKHIWHISLKADTQFMMSSDDTCKRGGEKKEICGDYYSLRHEENVNPITN